MIHNMREDDDEHDESDGEMDDGELEAEPEEAGVHKPKLPGTTFIRKLYSIVDNPSTNDIISWTEDGLSFDVKDPKRLEKEILPHCFRHSRIQSFIRQLNFYSFKKTTERLSRTFSHELFQRARPELLDGLKRKSCGPPRAANSKYFMYFGKQFGALSSTSHPNQQPLRDVPSVAIPIYDPATFAHEKTLQAIYGEITTNWSTLEGRPVSQKLSRGVQEGPTSRLVDPTLYNPFMQRPAQLTPTLFSHTPFIVPGGGYNMTPMFRPFTDPFYIDNGSSFPSSSSPVGSTASCSSSSSSFYTLQNMLSKFPVQRSQTLGTEEVPKLDSLESRTEALESRDEGGSMVSGEGVGDEIQEVEVMAIASEALQSQTSDSRGPTAPSDAAATSVPSSSLRTKHSHSVKVCTKTTRAHPHARSETALEMSFRDDLFSLNIYLDDASYALVVFCLHRNPWVDSSRLQEEIEKLLLDEEELAKELATYAHVLAPRSQPQESCSSSSHTSVMEDSARGSGHLSRQALNTRTWPRRHNSTSQESSFMNSSTAATSFETSSGSNGHTSMSSGSGSSERFHGREGASRDSENSAENSGDGEDDESDGVDSKNVYASSFSNDVRSGETASGSDTSSEQPHKRRSNSNSASATEKERCSPSSHGSDSNDSQPTKKNREAIKGKDHRAHHGEIGRWCKILKVGEMETMRTFLTFAVARVQAVLGMAQDAENSLSQHIPREMPNKRVRTGEPKESSHNSTGSIEAWSNSSSRMPSSGLSDVDTEKAKIIASFHDKLKTCSDTWWGFTKMYI